MNLGKAIKIELTRKGMSQNELAEKMVVTNAWISRVVNNHVYPGLWKLRLIASSLDMTLSALIIEAESLDDELDC